MTENIIDRKKIENITPSCVSRLSKPTKRRATHKIVVTEANLREQVRDLCRIYGWRFYFTWTSIHSPKGFPDLTLLSSERRRVIYVELKTEKGKVTDSQRVWLDDLTDCQQEVYLWRPGDIEEAARILRCSTPCKSRTSWDVVRTPIAKINSGG